MSAVRDELLRLLELPDAVLDRLISEAHAGAELSAHVAISAEGHEEPAPAYPGVDLRAVLDLISALRQVVGVRDVRYSSEKGLPDLWLLVDRDSDEITDRIADLDYEFRRRAAGSALYALHVVPLDSVAEQDLPLALPV